MMIFNERISPGLKSWCQSNEHFTLKTTYLSSWAQLTIGTPIYFIRPYYDFNLTSTNFD